METLRILHLGNIANVAARLGEYQRRLGHDVTVLAREQDHDKADADGIFYGHGPMRWNVAAWRSRKVWYQYDVLHIHGGIERSQVAILPILMASDSPTVILHFHGTDARTGRGLHYRSVADGLLVSTPDLTSTVPGSVWLPNPAPEAVRDNPLPKGPKVRFGHFPSNRAMKGTADILSAFAAAFGPVHQITLVDIPKSLQYRSDVSLFQFGSAELLLGGGLTHPEVAEAMDTCQIIIDQLNDFGAYGLTSLEAMARGRVALSSYRPELYPHTCAIVPWDRQSAPSVLQSLMSEERQMEAIRSGYGYVDSTHDPFAVAQESIDLYALSAAMSQVGR